MEIHTILALLLSCVIGISLGLFGGGGSILALPVLVYVAGIDPRESVPMSLAIVGSTSLFGSMLHWRKGYLDLKVAATFGCAGLIGAYFGAQLTHLLSGEALLLLFAAVMMAVGTIMLWRKDPAGGELKRSSRTVRLGVGLGVGVLTGFLGVGGGFLIVPALVLFAGIPMHMAVGTSLSIIAINSAAGFMGHLREVQLQLELTAALSAAAVAGTVFGARFASRVRAAKLRRLFACFVILVAVFVVAQNYRSIF